MELFLENTKRDVTSLRWIDFETIALEVKGKDERHTSKTGWDVDTGFKLNVWRRKQ
jgi:hypothetical protein